MVMRGSQATGAVAVRPVSPPPRRRLDLSASGPYFAGLLLLAVVAFWPSYLSRLGASSAYTHVHAATATLWMLFLVTQPLAIRTRRRPLHRALGKLSYGLAAAVLASIILLAHSRIAGLDGAAYARQTYVLYLQVSLAALFGLSYGLAILARRDSALHARFMVCTGLTLIDPVVVRLLLWADASPAWNYQLATFALTDLALLALMWMERDGRRGRWVFPGMLATFLLAQLPALLGWTGRGAWQAFARWFAALPLT